MATMINTIICITMSPITSTILKVAEQEGQQRGEEHQPGQEPARVRAHDLQLGRKLVLEIRI